MTFEHAALTVRLWADYEHCETLVCKKKQKKKQTSYERWEFPHTLNQALPVVRQRRADDMIFYMWVKT